MARYIYINGQYAPYHHAVSHVEDRAYLFGDAIYEVIAYINGYYADERAHLDRLERSLKELKIEMPVSRRNLQLLMREVIRKNRHKNAAIYIQISRGRAKRDFKFPANDTPPSLMIMTWDYDFESKAIVEKGLRIKTMNDLRWKRRDIKTILLLPQSMAKQEAVDCGYDDAWMVDDHGFITEGSSNNAYIVKDKKIITRPVSCDILKGATRNAIEKLCDQSDYKFIEQDFTPEEAYEADEAFVSSATAMIAPVVEIDDHKLGNGKPSEVFHFVRKEYLDYVHGLKMQPMSWESGLNA
ncbi:MAG: D-amino-acid transaminase [Pseudomonadota bacterium]